MKKLFIKYILLVILAMLLIACPSTADEGSSSNGSNDGSNNSGETTTKLYHVEDITSIDLKSITGVTVSPDGKNVYASAYEGNSVVRFNRNPSTGSLTNRVSIKDGDTITGVTVNTLTGATAVAVSPDNTHVYVASFTKGITKFNRNQDTGELTTPVNITNGGTVTGLNGATLITVSPDNNNVYVSSSTDSAVVTLKRTINTGALAHSQTITNATRSGLNKAVSVAVSPDNTHVYVAGRDANAVVVFSRNDSTGELTYVETLEDGKKDSAGNDIDGLQYVRTVIVSPDNNNVYVAGSDDNAVAIFTRNTSTGKLTYSGIIKHGDTSGGKTIEGLEKPKEIVVSPDNKYVYVGSSADIVVFTRNTSTGALTFEQMFKYTATGLTKISSIVFISVSPDGKHLYVASDADNSITVFERR